MMKNIELTKFVFINLSGLTVIGLQVENNNRVDNVGYVKEISIMLMR